MVYIACLSVIFFQLEEKGQFYIRQNKFLSGCQYCMIIAIVCDSWYLAFSLFTERSIRISSEGFKLVVV